MSNFPDRSSTDSALITTDINDLAQGTPTYESTRTYAENRIIEYLGIQYKSLLDSNTGNTPVSSPTKWEVIETGGGGVPLPFAYIDGDLLVGDNQIKVYFRRDAVLDSINIAVTTAPTGANINVDVRVFGGATILSSDVYIAAGTTSGSTTSLTTSSFNEGDILTIDIKLIGSTISGADLFIDFLDA